MHFSETDIYKLKVSTANIEKEYEKLLLKYSDRKFTNTDAQSFFVQGFFRRLRLLKTIIHNVYTIFPPDRLDRLNDDEVQNLTINLQAFVLNVFGCIDNLAWVWVKENSLDIDDNKKVSFNNKEIRQTLSDDFKIYLKTIDEWRTSYLKDTRDSLAHRVPPYVPPYMLNIEEQSQEIHLEELKWEKIREHKFDEYEEICIQLDKLGKSAPYFSQGKKYVVFHVQVISDWNTVVQFLEKFIIELDLKPNPVSS